MGGGQAPGGGQREAARGPGPGVRKGLCGRGGGARAPRARSRRSCALGQLSSHHLPLVTPAWQFLFVWVYVAKVPPGLGLAGAACKFAEVMALTWGGSQVQGGG